jgi:uncharacterized protein
MKREIRTIRGEVRARKGGKPGVEGYAAVFNQRSENLGWFREEIMPGAFANALAEDQDVRALINHDPNLVIGRTKSGTLTLTEDEKGLRFSNDLPDTQVARDLQVSMDRGDIDQCSFGFTVRKQTWIDEKDPATGQMASIRQINEIERLFDVSVVTYPAYPQTTADNRSLWPDGEPEDVAEHRALLESMKSDETRADKKTKRVDGEDLEAGSFLIVGDAQDTSTWKLPWKFSTEEKTKRHLRNALARFNQLKGVSDDVKKNAWKKLVSLCKKYDIKVSETDSVRSSLTAEQFRDMQDGDGPETCCQCECSPCQGGNCSLCTDEDCMDEACAENGCPQQSAQDGDQQEMDSIRMRQRLAEVAE